MAAAVGRPAFNSTFSTLEIFSATPIGNAGGSLVAPVFGSDVMGYPDIA